MRAWLIVSIVASGFLMASLAGSATAQPSPDYIRITPPPGMRWKTLDQSGVTNDIIVVDKQGDTWLKKAAAASFANSFLLVQLVGDTAGTDQWMKLVKEMPRFLGLQPDVDWQHYSAFTTSTKWQGLITEQRKEAFDALGPSGMAISPWVILPVYQSASDPSWLWWSADQGQFPPDAVLTGDFRTGPRMQAGRDTPYTVAVEDFSTNPPTEVTRRAATSSIGISTPTLTRMGYSVSHWRAIFRSRRIISFQRGHPAPTGCQGCKTARAPGIGSTPGLTRRLDPPRPRRRELGSCRD